MFARINTFEGAPDPERVKQVRQQVAEHVLPTLRWLDGFEGGLVLVSNIARVGTSLVRPKKPKAYDPL